MYRKIFFFVLFTVINIYAYPNGVSGYTSKTNASGCGACHSTHSGASSSILVQIIGPSELAPSEMGSYSVRISGGSGSKVGVDIALSSGALAKVDNNLKVLNSELTQPSSKTYSNGSYTFNFTVTAPSIPGTITLYATGMSKKQEWNFAQNFSIAVSNNNIVSHFDCGPGWNLVSVPLLLNDMTSGTVFPQAASPVYGFDGGYSASSVLQNASGYWVKFNSAQSFDFSGTEPQIPISLLQGWNLIGPFNTLLPVNTIVTNPPGILESAFYEFDSGYVLADTLKPGKGYWVKSSGSGSITLDK